MRAGLAFDLRLAGYDFGPTHPLRPERVLLTIGLLEAWGLLPGPSGPLGTAVQMLSPTPATDEDLLLVHSPAYLEAVRRASKRPEDASTHGLGFGDTPAFPGIHEAAALIAGATAQGLEKVASGQLDRVFAPAGGLHHAQHDRASGFCVYNDPAVAMARLLRDQPNERIAYVDIDAHHGDGVEQAFYERSDVLTLSVHESGRYLFPGTGRAADVGTGEGYGFALNVPLPPHADPACYELVATHVILPALRAYAPTVMVVQAGADSHRNDPLTHLGQSVAGFLSLVRHLIGAAEELTGGRLLVTGGGGYDAFSAVPRMWAGAFCELIEIEVPERLPATWRAKAMSDASRYGIELPEITHTTQETVPEADPETSATAMQATLHAIAQAKSASPLLDSR